MLVELASEAEETEKTGKVVAVTEMSQGSDWRRPRGTEVAVILQGMKGTAV